MKHLGEPHSIVLHGARCATGPTRVERCSLEIRRGHIHAMLPEREGAGTTSSPLEALDLSGFLLLPGLINPHDHLEFALFPRLAAGPYRNYIEWGEDIHRRFPDLIAVHRSIPKDVRAGWGGIRNLLCGVTTVSHHNPLHPEMLDTAYPVRVLRDYGWAHSAALGGDLLAARAATPRGAAFLMHACEGTDAVAREELRELDRLGLLDESAVFVHGLALNPEGVAHLIKRRTSLIVCPSSNQFLFDALPDLSLLGRIPHLALGNDSPLTAVGDLLDEIRFAIECCDLTAQAAWAMVTDAPARILRLRRGAGTLQPGSPADLLVVRDRGVSPADTLAALTMRDVELVMIGGRVQLASQALLDNVPASMRSGLEPLSIDGMVRWLRAPVPYLLRRAEQVLGAGQVRLGRRLVTAPARQELENAC